MNYSELTPNYIRAIAPYQPGKPISELERELGITDIVKLASNENPLGASPKAIAAARDALNEISLYPDGNGFALKAALVARYGVAIEQVFLGNGSNDLLELVARAFLTVGDKAVYSDHAFAVYPLATQGVGAIGISVAAKDYGHDLDAMRKVAVEQGAKLIYIANPNNPTGTFLPGAELHAFMRALPEHILVVLDEAYNEYLPEECRYDSVAWLPEFRNLIISRTFSKAYGLASLRVGYALGDAEVMDMINRVRQPFNVNSMAQAAARAALEDTGFVRATFELNLRGMQQLTEGLTALGLDYIPSYGNFISFRIGDAATAYRRLLELGVIVRPIASYAMPEYLRVSIGLESQNQKFLSALKQILGEKA
jgi:histidinol-phosphate aminotransferase